MKKDSLKDWFKFQVWRQSGGTLPELCDLSEIREWLNETAADPDLAARISILETATDKVQTAASGTPDAPVASSVSLPIGESSLDFTARTKGVIGDSITITLINPEADSDIGVAVTGKNIEVTLGYDAGAIKSSLADIKTAIEETPAAHALVAVAVTGSDATIAIAVDKTSFADGADGTTGVAGALRFDSSKLYVSVVESTTAVSNWKSITFDAEQE